MNNKLKINLNIFHGERSLKNLKNILNEQNYKKPIILLDRKVSELKYVKEKTNFIKNKKILSFKTEPTYQMLDKEIIFLRKKKIDCIIAIGGGSTIDFAKGLSILYTNKGKAISFMGFPKNLNKLIPIIAVPTTTSTGSEIVFNAVFTDQKTKKKFGINYENNYPTVSILDPVLIKGAPNKIIYQSALASLMRSIETYSSPDSDEITKFFSKKAYSLIIYALKNKIIEKQVEYLQWGCVFSMIALSNSSSGPCGIINYYFSTHYNIPQPFSYSFTAVQFINHNIKSGYLGYADLIDNPKIHKKKKLKIFKKDLVFAQKLIEKEIKYTKKKFVDKSILEKNIYQVFRKKKFLPLLKNPIRIKRNDLKKIIHNILN